MGHGGEFNENDKAMIREIARQMLPEFEMQLMQRIELQVWRTAGKLILATGLVSSIAATIVTKGIEYVVRK